MSSSCLCSMFLSIEICEYIYYSGLHYFGIDPVWLAAIIPIKTYSNAEADKVTILKENKNQSGIYMWTNNINNKKYIGSSGNLRARFLKYFNQNHLLENSSMNICKALIKHGYSNFSLTIIEYCEVSELLEREKYSWKLFKPEYNIAQDPTAPMSGRTHSDDTKRIMSGENHPNYGKNLSEETRTKISDALQGKPKVEGSGKPSQVIEVTDITNNTTISYDSISEAAKALNIKQSTITNYILRNQHKPYKGIYTFKKDQQG